MYCLKDHLIEWHSQDRERAIRNPLTHLGRELSIDDLVLVQVRHVSRGSIQPVLGVLRR